MNYLQFDFEGERFLIELSKEGYALRQIVISNKQIHQSCFEDCLAEGVIHSNELEGDVCWINEQLFNKQWEKYKKRYNKQWKNVKTSYPIGKTVQCTMLCIYPQGFFVDINNWKGVIKNTDTLSFMVEKRCDVYITGYDEQNMWLIVEPLYK